MANCVSYPERRSRSKDKARDKAVEVDKDKAARVKVEIKVGRQQRRAQIKARARDKVMAAGGAVVGIRINSVRSISYESNNQVRAADDRK